MLSSIWKGNFDKLPANCIYNLIIDYPLEEPVIIPIKTGKFGMGLFKFLKKIGAAYEKIYDDNKGQFKVYGHDIYDLNLSGISVNHKTKKIKLSVDS